MTVSRLVCKPYIIRNIFGLVICTRVRQNALAYMMQARANGKTLAYHATLRAASAMRSAALSPRAMRARLIPAVRATSSAVSSR